MKIERPLTIDNFGDNFLGTLDDSFDNFLSTFEELLKETAASYLLRPFRELYLVLCPWNIGSCQSKVDIPNSSVVVSL
jgi:hypothetical protein